MSTKPQDPSGELGYISRLFRDPRRAFSASESDLDALDYLDEVRWPTEVLCPRCAGAECYIIPRASHRNRRWRRCRSCNHQFSPISGTVLSNEHVPPADLVLSVSIATQFTGPELASRISEACGISTARANRLALLLQHLFDSQAGSGSGHLRHAFRSTVLLEPEQWDAFLVSRARSSNGVVALSRIASKIGTALAATAVLAFVAWAAGAFDQVLVAEWTHKGEQVVLQTERQVGESVASWHQRHERKLNSYQSLMGASMASEHAGDTQDDDPDDND